MGRWRSRAFGIELEGSRAVPGLRLVEEPEGGPTTSIELVSAGELARAWPSAGTTRLLAEPSDEPRPSQTIDWDERIGYRLHASGYGTAIVDPRGEAIRVALVDSTASRGQRFLIGRVLPWVALLNGLEVFHASAVAFDGHAVAFIGPSGAGKSSAALGLLLAGGRLVTDDVLALQKTSSGALLAHPGVDIAALREPEWTLLKQAGLQGSGVRLLDRDGKAYVSLPSVTRALPLAGVYLLTRLGSDQVSPEQANAIEPLQCPDPRVLLGSTFIRSVQTAPRLRNQLEVCAELVRSVPFYRVRGDAGGRGRELSAKLGEHARARCAAASTAPAHA